MKKIITNILPQSVLSKIQGKKNLINILNNTGWLFFDKVLRMGIGLIVGVWVARYLGPDLFGIWNYAIAFVALFAAFSTLGLDSILVRELVKEPHKKNELLGSALVIRLIGAVFGILTIIVVLSYLRPSDNYTLALVAIMSLAFLFQSFDVIDFYFQSEVKSKYTVYARNISFLIFSGVKVLLILNKCALIAFVWVGLFEIVISSFLLIIFYFSYGQRIYSWKIDQEIIKKLFNDGWPLILSGLVIMIYMRIDQIMLGQMVNSEAVGNYSAAVRISEIWYFIPMIITSSIFPSIINAKASNKELYLNRLQKLYDLMTSLSLIIAIILSFFSNFIVSLLYGSQYKEAGNILTVHIWSGIFVFQGVASSQFLMAENLTKIAFYRTAFGALVNVVLNIILIPSFGGLGAAIATLIAYFCATFFIVFFKATRMQFFLILKSFSPLSMFRFFK